MWTRQGRIFTIPGGGWRASHAQQPTIDRLHGDRLRIFYATRGADNRALTTFVDVRESAPHEVIEDADRVVLGLGELGCFDDSGVMPSWVVDHDGAKYLYYTGWNTSTTVPHRNAIGLAVSVDGGRTFARVHTGPVMDRSATEPHFCAAPCVLLEGGVWRMWYSRCIRWTTIGGKVEPLYHIRYAESRDGIHWKSDGVVCIDFASPEEAGIVRPSIVIDDSGYKMWFSHRNLHDYRTRVEASYRIGYAESDDGIVWRRMDEVGGLSPSPSDPATNWDAQMVAYPFVHRVGRAYYMFYNGNGFGASGIGYAIAEVR